jgi:hypothetical protein
LHERRTRIEESSPGLVGGMSAPKECDVAPRGVSAGGTVRSDQNQRDN